jgi:hypothetical protein
MTVYELIQQLQQFDGDAEVFIASQPSWALQHHIGEIAEVDDVSLEIDEEPDDDHEPIPAVYIAEGSQCDEPYLPSAAAAELGW